MAPEAASWLRGAIAWAVVSYGPEAPFRVRLGSDQAPAKLPDAQTYAEQIRHGALDAETTLVVAGKLRPIVLLQDRPRGVLREVVALGMVRLAILSTKQQASIRDQHEPSLFHLPVRPAKYGLSNEMAVDLNALVRVHVSAMLPKTVGRLDDNEMRVVGQRLIKHLDVDLEPLLARLVDERLDELTAPARA